MSKHDEVLLYRGVRSDGNPPQPTPRRGVRSGDNPPQPTPRRINVAVSQNMLAAIDRVIEREHVTLTEAVRRLITYGDFVYRTAKVESGTLMVRLPDGSEKEVLLV